MDCSMKEEAGHRDQEDVLGFGQEMGQCIRHRDCVGKECASCVRTGKCVLPTENCTSRAMFLRQRNWSPLPGPLPSLLPKLPKPHAKPSTKGAAKPAAQAAAKLAAQPAAGEPIPVAPVEHAQLFRVKCCRQKKWHAEAVSQ